MPWTDSVDWDHDSDLGDVLFNRFQPGVARLREIDPVTTEIVRLRGATQHNCRLCKSRREGHALDAGGTESLYEQIEWYETSAELVDRHKAALRYADAMIWTPANIAAGGGGRRADSLHRGRGVRADRRRDAQRGQQDNGRARGRCAEESRRGPSAFSSTRTGRRSTAEGAYNSMREPMITVLSRGRPNRSAASAVM